VKRALRTKSVGTKVSEAELRVLESRAASAGLTLSECVRDVLLGSSVEMGTMAAERAILAEMLAMRAILLNFMLKLSARQPITEQISRELIAWADSNKMKRALEILAENWGQTGRFRPNHDLFQADESSRRVLKSSSRADHLFPSTYLDWSGSDHSTADRERPNPRRSEAWVDLHQ
jgi:hypothetical protein